METLQVHPKIAVGFVALVLAALLIAVVACDQPGQPATINASDSGPTDTPSILPADATFNAVKLAGVDDSLHGGERKETEIAQHATADALTPTYTPVPTTPTPTTGPPEPTPTWALGMIHCGVPTAGYPYVDYTCWSGIVNGRHIYVDTGAAVTPADLSQGVVTVSPPDPPREYEDVYETPFKLGGVSIISVEGTTFTLSTVDQPTPTIFTFDLATHQFILPSGTPIPATPMAP